MPECRVVAGDQHTPEEVLAALRAADAAAVGTRDGEGVRLRMMHHAPADDFTVYLATMKGDPKVRQLLAHDKVSILGRTTTDAEADIREVEIEGRIEIVTDSAEEARALALTKERSSIVAALAAAGNTGILEFLAVRPAQAKMRVFAEIVQGMAPTVLEFDVAAARKPVRVLATTRQWLSTARAAFLPAVVLPVLAGILLGWRDAGRPFAWGPALLALAGSVLAHLGANLLNDVGDQDTDALNRNFVSPFSGGSRAIQLGLASPRALAGAGIACLAAAVLCGAVIAWTTTWLVAPIAFAGGAIAVGYSLGPRLVAHGIGEVAVAAAFGICSTLGGFAVEARGLSWRPVLLAVPFCLLVAAILYVNEIPDAEADAASGKRTLVVRLPRGLRLPVLAVFAGLGVASVAAVVVADVVPDSALVALLGLPAVAWAVREQTRGTTPVERAAGNAAVITIHLVVGVVIVVALAAAGLGLATGVQWLLVAAATATVAGWNGWRIASRRAGLGQVIDSLGGPSSPPTAPAGA